MDPITLMTLGIPLALTGYLTLSKAGRASREVGKGNLALSMGRYREAVEHYNEAIRLDSSNPALNAIHYSRAAAYAELGELSSALDDIGASLALRTSADALAVRAAIFLKMGRAQEALADADEAVQLKPSIENLLTRAGVHLAQEQFEKAAEDCGLALKREPTPGSFLLRSEILLRAGRPEEALEDAEQAVKLGRQLSAYLKRARCHEALGDYSAALEDYDTLLKKFEDPVIYSMRGHLKLLRLDDPQGALDDLAKAVTLAPDSAAHLNALGMAYGLRGEFERAVELFEQANQKEPLATFEANVGEALYHLGRFDEAEAACKRAIKLDPDLGNSYAVLGLVSMARGDSQKALARAQLALEANGDHGWALELKARALEALGRFDEAVDAYAAFVRVAETVLLMENDLERRAQTARERIRVLAV